MTVFVNQAIPLIEIHEDDKFAVNESAVRMLRTIQEKVCVVAVAGLYRTGKSSLLNWLLDRNAGFTVGPSINRCTRGLWIWGTPLNGSLSTGEPCKIIVLDTEGIGGVEGDSKYDARIFSLALLLCSSLIYNSLGSIDETAISNLSFIAQLSNHIKISASNAAGENEDEDGDASDFCKIFPSFVWVVRDFTLQLVDEDGDPISPTQYLENSLEQTPGFDKQTLERNRIRNMLSAFFPNRKCVTLVRPVSDEQALQQVTNPTNMLTVLVLTIEQVDLISYGDLRPDFRDSMEELKSIVFGSLQPKSIDNKPLNGPMFAGLVGAYVGAINAGGVPTISSAWEGVSQQECLDAKENALCIYNDSLHSKCPVAALPIEEGELRRYHEESTAVSVTAYKQRAVGSSAKEVLDRLQVDINTVYTQYMESNISHSTTLCGTVVAELFDTLIRPKLSENEMQEKSYVSDLKGFRDDWNELYRQYMGRARGPSKYEVLSTFSKSKLLDCTGSLLNTIKCTYEERIEELQETLQERSTQLSARDSECNVLRDKNEKSEALIRTLEADNADLTAQCTSSAASLEELTKNKRQAERNFEEEKEIRTRLEGKNSILGDRVRELEGKETEIFELRAERDKLSQRVTELQEENEALLNAKDKKRCVIS